MSSSGDPSHFKSILNSLTAGTSKDAAKQAMGSNVKEEGGQLRLYCPSNEHYVYANISDGKPTTVLGHWRLPLLLWALYRPCRAEGRAGLIFNPADIMEDMYESPRFQIQMLDELIPESQLHSTFMDLKRQAKAAPKGTALPVDADSASLPQNHSPVYDPVIAKAGRKWKFLCQVPRVDKNSTAAKTKGSAEDSKPSKLDARKEDEQAIMRGLELLQPLKRNCISYTAGWWTFEYCHDQRVRQYHRTAPDKNGDVAEIEYRLGDYSHRKQYPAIESSESDASGTQPEVRTTQIRQFGRKRFLTQVWAGGTVCDITRQPREVEIQFHCDPNSPERIVHVEEIAICQYVMVINTPRLCADPSFYDVSASAVNDIKCQQVVTDNEYDMLMAERDSLLHLEPKDQNTEEVQANEAEQDDVPLAMLARNSLNQRHWADAQRRAASDVEEPPQLVISLKDPRLAKTSRENEEMVRQLLALAYGDMSLKITFAEDIKVASLAETDEQAKETDKEAKT
ncbi:Protein OS-9 [Coemansia sp. RSA 2336]|nr:Protein OS-9 [Coemansia sp. RSA 2336]